MRMWRRSVPPHGTGRSGSRRRRRSPASFRWLPDAPQVIEVWEQPARPARADAIPVGARVFHQKFGYGTVKAAEDDRLDITFEKAGEKRVLDRFVERA